MALETHSGAKLRYSNKMHEDGQTLKGYLKDAVTGSGNYGDTFELVMVDEQTGSEFNVVTGGTLKYVAKNLLMHLGKIKKDAEFAEDMKKDALLLGCYVEVSPAGSYRNKKGQEIKSYLIQRDPEKKIGDFVGAGNVEQDTENEIPF